MATARTLCSHATHSLRMGRGVAALLATGLLTLATPALAAAADDPFDLLGGLRASLRSQSPFTAQFRQTLSWADWADDDGFGDDEDAERGEMAVSLPSCLRWDFGGDFAKSYLLCDDLAHSWSPGDARGRRVRIDEQMALEAPGLDFFLLSVEELRARYRVAAPRRVAGEQAADSPALDGAELSTVPGVHLQLTPIEPIAEVAQLDVVLDAEGRQVRVLSYVDQQGNRTTFELYGYGSGVRRGAFAPPAKMEWEDS